MRSALMSTGATKVSLPEIACRVPRVARIQLRGHRQAGERRDAQPPAQSAALPSEAQQLAWATWRIAAVSGRGQRRYRGGGTRRDCSQAARPANSTPRSTRSAPEANEGRALFLLPSAEVVYQPQARGCLYAFTNRTDDHPGVRATSPPRARRAARRGLVDRRPALRYLAATQLTIRRE